MRRMLIAILIVAALFFVGVSFVAGQTSAAPEQPIAFSHKNHAVDRQIACEYCHTGARTGMVAGIPPVETCMGCHRTVGLVQGKPIPATQPIHDAWNNQQPIQWVRLTYLPQHAVFAHQPHLTQGVQCLECHAQGNPPDRWFQAFRPSMAWCLTCHSGRGAGTDCWTCHK